MADQKLFPEGMQPLGESRLHFPAFPEYSVLPTAARMSI